ncbi:MAG TPA: O-antigen ligase family protein, partial [Microthrixaceae bacterium]|nr:O-antigen ligase family protein [Microthrixaceae bacterium]
MASIPLLLFAILNRWGVLVLILVAMATGLGVWVWNRGFVLVEIIGFLIHFDGIGFGPIRMGRIVAGVIVCIIVYKLVVDRWRPPAVPLKNWLPIWTLTVWTVASGIWSSEIGGWIQAMLMFGLALAFFCVTSMLVDSHKAIQQFLRAYWVGGLFGSSLGIIGLGLGMRAVGFGSDPNYFGLLEASMIPLTIYYRRNATDPRMRRLYTLALLMVLGGSAGAGSRSGLIAGAIVIVATMITKPGLSRGRRTKVAAFALMLAPIAFLIGFIANPNNLERGLTNDRGAGRLDFWTVTVQLIKERPIVGHGFGQIQSMIPDRVLVTPGSKRFNEDREAVSSHNTWMDTWGDLGIIGLTNFVGVFAIAVYCLMRPRWPYTKELSTTILVMLLPVFSSSMFLPLLNNKLAWAVLGLAAAVQVPSVNARWSGLAGAKSPDEERKELTRARSTALARVGTSDLVPVGVQASSEPVINPDHVDQMPEVEFAKWDFRLPGSVIRGSVAAAILGGIL